MKAAGLFLPPHVTVIPAFRLALTGQVKNQTSVISARFNHKKLFLMADFHYRTQLLERRGLREEGGAGNDFSAMSKGHRAAQDTHA